MNSGRIEGKWKQFIANAKRRWDTLFDDHIGLWAGKRDCPKPVARTHARLLGGTAQVRTNAKPRHHP
jgi:hypothetical protein